MHGRVRHDNWVGNGIHSVFSLQWVLYKPLSYYPLTHTHCGTNSQYTHKFLHIYTITHLCKYISVRVFTISTQMPKQVKLTLSESFFVNFYVLFVFLPTPAFQPSLPQGCFDFYKGTNSIPVNISCVYAHIQKIHIHTFHACMHSYKRYYAYAYAVSYRVTD